MIKFWNFIKNAATETQPESVELRIEGDFVDDENVWIYEWFGIPAASPNAFREELAQYAGKNLSVWINSYGGSVFAAAGIYNALMEHKKTGAKVTTIVDAKAMSAATIPFMAGDERLMSPVAMFMIHNPLTRAEGYASDLRKVADVLDVVKETIINAYQLATGRSRAKISAMMNDETYMSAKTAIKEGFATGMLYANTASDDGEPPVLNFAFNRLAIVNNANEIFKHLSAIEDKLKSFTQDKEKEDKTLDIKNIEDLRQHFPDLVTQVEAAARQEGAVSERQRLQAIDEISATIAPDLVNKAKYEQPITAQELAFESLKADAAKGRQFIDQRAQEINNSGANNVAVASGSTQGDGTEEVAVVDKIAAAANQKRVKEGK